VTVEVRLCPEAEKDLAETAGWYEEQRPGLGQEFGGKSRSWESSNARMAISAKVDSDICRWAATAANSRFSGGVGRAVIDGTVAFKAPSFTAHQSRIAAHRGHFAILPSLQ
jgi:hypothetical protein